MILRPLKGWNDELWAERQDLVVMAKLRNRREAQAYRLRKLHGKLYHHEINALFRRVFGN